MRKLLEFLSRIGFILMFCGIAITAASLFFSIKYQYIPGIQKKLAITAAVVGVVIYLTGRIAIMLQKHYLGKKSSSDEEYILEDNKK